MVFIIDVCFCFFFKQKSEYEMRISDWSSDVCSSDLIRARIKRVFPRAPTMAKEYIRISDSPENSRELEWFLQRYPMVFQPESIIDRLTAQEIGRASGREGGCHNV